MSSIGQAANPAFHPLPVMPTRQAPQPPMAPASQAPAQTAPALPSVLQQLVNAFATLLRTFATWLGSLFRKPQPTPVPPPTVMPTQPQAPAQPQPAQTQVPVPQGPVSPLDAPFVPYKSVSNKDNTLTAGVGFTQIEDQTGLAGRLDAQIGGTQVQAIAAHTTSDTLTETVASARVQNSKLQAEATVRDRNGQLSASGAVATQVGDTAVRGQVTHAEGQGTMGTLMVAGPRLQAAVSGLHHNDRTAVAGQLAAQVGQDGRLTASGLYEQTSEAARASVTAGYQDRTTDASLRYMQENDTRYVGGSLDKRFEHSTLGIGGDYISNAQGDGGRLYGRWKTDEVGPRALGYQIRGEMEAGALKMPGQDWNTYAAGRIVGEKENSSFFLGVQHQQGPMFSRPETSINAGFQIRF